VQGILEWMRIPYTHSGVMASAVAMDKERAKAVYVSEGLPIAESILATPADISADHVMAPPYVVKPYNEGSSVGIHIASEGANTPPQVNTPGAPERLMVERYVPGRELTVSVMDGEAMAVTEIIAEGWYDYAAKYEAGGSRHEVPANLPQNITAQCLDYAVRAHRALGCRGVSRSDFRYDPEKGEVIILETNTQPGMTPTSLSPEQASHKGTSFSELVAWMVEDASCGR
jgi:D-alanine-D-alanine ligase